jgi:hypothetical protein
MQAKNPAADTTLLTKINKAVAAANEAEATVTTAKAELVSRSKAVGVLLLEAKKLHPTVKDFEAFLERVDGLKLSRAYDLLRLAGGRTTDEEIRKATRDRVKKHRTSKKKLPQPTPKKPEPLSVTLPDVTESSGAEKRKAEQKVFNSPQEAKAAEKTPKWFDAARQSSRALSEFAFSCQTYLPKITVEVDRDEARRLVAKWLGEPKAEAA